jgi:hypothetical protein
MTKKNDDLPMIDTGHERVLQKMLRSYKVDGHRAAIEDAMQFCRQKGLINNGSICDELKKLVEEVQHLYPLRNRRGEVKARRGRSSTPDTHVDRFVRVELERKHQPSINKAIQVVAQQAPVTSAENVRRSHDLVDKATGDIVGDSYQRLYPEPED